MNASADGAGPELLPGREMAPERQELELALLRAQLVQATRINRSPGIVSNVTSVVKVVGSIILGLGGISAAITGYQLNELKNERLLLSMEKEEQKLASLREQAKLQNTAIERTSKALLAYQEVVNGGLGGLLGGLDLRAAAGAKLQPTVQGAVDERNIEFEKVKNEIRKLSQMQQALSKALDAMNDSALSAIRSIKAG
jgi:hypothetical protein